MPRRSGASLAYPASGAERLRPPSDLDGVERQIFIDLVAAARPDAFRVSDLPLLCAYSRAISLERRSAAELAAGNAKALPLWNGAIKAVVALSMRLRLSPQARAPNVPSKPGKPEPPLSVYERMALESDDAAADEN